MKKSPTRGSATYVGLDVHKASISVALLGEGQSELESLAEIWGQVLH